MAVCNLEEDPAMNLEATLLSKDPTKTSEAPSTRVNLQGKLAAPSIVREYCEDHSASALALTLISTARPPSNITHQLLVSLLVLYLSKLTLSRAWSLQVGRPQ